MTALPPKAEKLLCLALNDAAMIGEWQNAAVKFVELLRSEGIGIDEFKEPPPTQQSQSPFVMPFGKFKGRLISSLPDDYLAWMSANMDLREPLKSAVFNEIKRRSSQ